MRSPPYLLNVMPYVSYTAYDSPLLDVQFSPILWPLPPSRLLQSRAASLPGRVVLLFQPAEEGGGGARLMAREGALRGVGAVHGLHVWPGLPAGEG